MNYLDYILLVTQLECITIICWIKNLNLKDSKLLLKSFEINCQLMFSTITISTINHAGGCQNQVQDDDKTNVEPVHSYDAFHTSRCPTGVNGIIGMHRFNICLVVVLLWCENTIRLICWNC